MLVSKTLKFALPPTPTPNPSRWNKGGIGTPTQGAGVGQVNFILFTSYSLALGTQRKPSFQWNTGFNLIQGAYQSEKDLKGLNFIQLKALVLNLGRNS